MAEFANCPDRELFVVRSGGVRRFACAFTLVELLIVVGTLGLLVAILIPAVARVRSQASAVRCLSNIRQLGVALKIYAANNKESYPVNVTAPTPKHWNDPAILGLYLAPPITAMNASSVFWCPADEDAQQSYAMNIWASSAVDKTIANLTTGGLWSPRRNSSAMFVLAESWSYQSGTGTGYLPSPTIGAYGDSAGQRFGGIGGVGPIAAGRWGQVNCELTFSRHRSGNVAGDFTLPKGRVSIYFDDGHAALCADSELVDSRTGASSGLAAWSSQDFVRN